MKVNGRKGIKMAVQDEFPTMELVISRHYKAHSHQGVNHMENTVEDDGIGLERKEEINCTGKVPTSQ